MGCKSLSRLSLLVIICLLVATCAYSATVGNAPRHIKVKGQNTSSGPLELDEGESPDCLNVHTSLFNNLVKRKGYSKLSTSHTHISTSTGKTNGLYDFTVDSSTTKFMRYVDTRLYKMDTLADTGFFYLTFATAMTDDIMEFENMDGTLIMTTWSRDLPQSWNGTASSTSDITNMPKGQHVIQAYNRIFVSDVTVGGVTYELRFYFSNAGSHTTWTTATDYETLDAPSGDEAMGWGLLKGRLFGFTKYTVNLVSDVGGKTPMQVTRRIDGIGCGAPRTIKTVNIPGFGESIVWLSQDKKLYAWNGSELKEISLRIHFDNTLSSVAMELIDDTNLKYAHAQVYEKEGWYIVWIPITTNIDYGIIYDYNTDTLWPASNQNFWASTVVELSTGKVIYVADRTGGVYKWNDGDHDNNTAINSYWTSRRWDFGFLPQLKKMGEVRIVTKALGNYPLYYQYRYNFENSWSTQQELTMIDGGTWLLGDNLPATLGSPTAQVHRLTIPGKFNLFQIKLSDNSSNPSWSVYSLDIVTNVLKSIGD